MRLPLVTETNWEETKEERQPAQHPSALPESLLIILAFSSSPAPFVKAYHHLMKQLGLDSLNMLFCSSQA